MSANVGDGWRTAKDGSFAFKKGRLGTIQVSGTQNRPSRQSRYHKNAILRKRALKALFLLF